MVNQVPECSALIAEHNPPAYVHNGDVRYFPDVRSHVHWSPITAASSLLSNIHQSDDWRRLRLGLQLADEFGLPPAAVPCQVLRQATHANAYGLYATGISNSQPNIQSVWLFPRERNLEHREEQIRLYNRTATDREQLQGPRGLARRSDKGPAYRYRRAGRHYQSGTRAREAVCGYFFESALEQGWLSTGKA